MSRTIERRDGIPLALPGQISRAAENDTQHLWDCPTAISAEFHMESQQRLSLVHHYIIII